jgi:hypothetical protein
LAFFLLPLNEWMNENFVVLTNLPLLTCVECDYNVPVVLQYCVQHKVSMLYRLNIILSSIVGIIFWHSERLFMQLSIIMDA